MSLHGPIPVLCLVALSTSCATTTPGRLSEHGFAGERFAYEIAWADGAEGVLVGREWRIASHYVDRRGRVHGPKRGAGYEAKLEADLDGDGSLEQIGGPFLYDLRLEHDTGGGVLFVRHVPVPTSLESAALDDVADRWRQDFESGRGGLAVPHAARADARVFDQRRLSVDGADAHALLVDAAAAGELAMPRRTSRVRAVLVVVRAGFVFEETSALGRRVFQALTIVGYAAPVDRFDPELGAVRALLASFRTSFPGERPVR